MDLDADYVALARERVAREGAPTVDRWDGSSGRDVVTQVLAEAGFTSVEESRISGSGLVTTVAIDARGGRWVIEVGGAFVRDRSGLSAGDALWRSIGRASVLHGVGERVVILTAGVPAPRSEGDMALRAVIGHTVVDVIDVFDQGALERLALVARGD